MTIVKVIIVWLIVQRNTEQEQVLIVASPVSAYVIIHAEVFFTFFSDIFFDCVGD